MHCNHSVIISSKFPLIADGCNNLEGPNPYTSTKPGKKVVVFGHSYAKSLEGIMPTSEIIDDVKMVFKFVCQGGLSHEKCINTDEWFKKIQENLHIFLET